MTSPKCIDALNAWDQPPPLGSSGTIFPRNTRKISISNLDIVRRRTKMGKERLQNDQSEMVTKRSPVVAQVPPPLSSGSMLIWMWSREFYRIVGASICYFGFIILLLHKARSSWRQDIGGPELEWCFRKTNSAGNPNHDAAPAAMRSTAGSVVHSGLFKRRTQTRTNDKIHNICTTSCTENLETIPSLQAEGRFTNSETTREWFDSLLHRVHHSGQYGAAMLRLR